MRLAGCGARGTVGPARPSDLCDLRGLCDLWGLWDLRDLRALGDLRALWDQWDP